MELIHLIQSIFIFFNLMVLVYIFIRFVKCKTCNNSIDIMNKNLDLLNSIHKKQYSDDLKKMVELYSEVQTVLKVSEASFISLFRYDYSRKYITLHFMFSINKDGEIIHESYLDRLPATSNLLNLEILKSPPLTLNSIKSEELKDIDSKAYEIIKYRGIEKMYFSNIIKDKDSPVGYLSFSYADDYELDERQQEEIMRIIIKISNFL